MSILGTRVVRTEDPRLLTAGGTYVDDVRLPEMADAARVMFVRSPFAHARIKAIDTAAASAMPGVHAVLTFEDVRPLLTQDRLPLELRLEPLPPNVTPLPSR